MRKVDAITLYDEFNAGYAGVMIGIKCNRSRTFVLGFHPWQRKAQLSNNTSAHELLEQQK
jgi:hypothetical protein